jgi:hypothetical protein
MNMTNPVLLVSKIEISIIKTNPPGLATRVEGEVGSPGWTGFALDHPIYIAPPPDGIYEAEMVGDPPDAVTAQVKTPFCFEENWVPFPADLKGLRVCCATNSVTAMLE